MRLLRIAPWLTGALAIACMALWWSADAASEVPAMTEARAFEQLAAVAADHGRTIAAGRASFTRLGDAVVAHAPLTGIAGYSDADFEAGVLILAIAISEPVPGRIPSGRYVVQLQVASGSDAGIATFLDAEGEAVASVPAQVRRSTVAEPAARDEPHPPDRPTTATTHVWRDRFTVECAGWQPYRVISF
jgi:hypothetical protein